MNPAYNPYLNHDRAQARLALALKAKGWEIFGYTEGDPDATDEVNLAHWHGYAKHPDYPDMIVVCGLTDSNQKDYRGLDWPDTFAASWSNSWYYHIEFEGKHMAQGVGVYLAGSLGEQGDSAVATHVSYIIGRGEKYINKRRKAAEKAAAKAATEQRKADRLAARQAKAEGKKNTKQAGAGAAPTNEADETDEAAETAEPIAGEEPETAPATHKRAKKEEEVNPADLVFLPPMSPLIIDRTPVVIDALVANMINRPTILPPETDFEAIAAAKIAEYYGFDAAKTTEAARQLAALLKNPEITSLAPGLRNNTLRTHARTLLH